MTLLQRLQEDMKVAMKAGQKDRLSVIRMLINEVKLVDLSPRKTTEQEAVASYARKLQKTIEEFERLNRPEEARKTRQELAIVAEYLPRKASPEETAHLVEQFLSQNTFTDKQFGQAMAAFMKLHGTSVDGALANRLLREKLLGKAS